LERSDNYWVLGLETKRFLERKNLWRKTYVLVDEIIKSLAIWDDT
jgi:hypothetical protein